MLLRALLATYAQVWVRHDDGNGGRWVGGELRGSADNKAQVSAQWAHQQQGGVEAIACGSAACTLGRGICGVTWKLGRARGMHGIACLHVLYQEVD